MRILSIFLLTVTCLSLAACGSDGDSANSGDGGVEDFAALDGGLDTSPGTEVDRPTPDDSFDGLYETLAHRKRFTCDDTQPWSDVIIIDQYFRLETTDVVGQPMLAYFKCTGDTVDTCGEKMLLFQSMFWVEGKWTYWLAATMFLDDKCKVSVTTGSPSLDDGEFFIELTNKSASLVGPSETECTIDVAATVPPDQMTCAFQETYLAKRID